MTCKDVALKLNAFLDGELVGRESRLLQQHMEGCPSCARHVSDLRAVQEVIEAPVRLSPLRSRQMRRDLAARFSRSWTESLLDRFRDLKASLRDVDRGSALWRLAGIPLSVGFLFVLAAQLPSVPLQRWTFPVFAPQVRDVAEAGRRPVLVSVYPSDRTVNGLMDAAWRIPYEDSFAMVVEIQPEGHAQIGDVLEYPKTMELMDAVDLTLQESRFDTTLHMANSFLIYSFQKVDVYEGL